MATDTLGATIWNASSIVASHFRVELPDGLNAPTAFHLVTTAKRPGSDSMLASRWPLDLENVVSALWQVMAVRR